MTRLRRRAGIYCEIGEVGGHGRSMLESVKTLGADAMAVIAMGACAAYGGVPSAAPNTTGCKGVSEVFAEEGISTPVVNLPGCPPHPDWFVGTIATVLIGGLGAVELDELGRPTAFYSKLIHDNCPRRGQFDNGEFAKKYSDPGCLYELGCKGPVTYADCPIRLWNGGTNWCVGSGGPCAGCSEPGFPDSVTSMRSVAPIFSATPPSWLPPMDSEKEGISTGLAAGISAVAGVAAGAAVTTAIMSKSKEKSED